MDVTNEIARQKDIYITKILEEFFDAEEHDISLDEEFIYMHAKKEVDKEFSNVTPQKLQELRTKVIRDLRIGKRTPEIRRWLVQSCGLTPAFAGALIRTVNKILDEEYAKYRETVAKSNVNTLLELRDEAVDCKDNRLALDVVRELNKMCNVYNDSISISSDGEITISFE